MSATLDGTPWAPVYVGLTSFGNSLGIIASDCTYELYVLVVPLDGPGTYTLGGRNPSAGELHFDPPGAARWEANSQGGSGSVTVTAFKKPTSLEDWDQGRASGTFSLTLVPVNGATGTKVVTDGRFESGFVIISGAVDVPAMRLAGIELDAWSILSGRRLRTGLPAWPLSRTMGTRTPALGM